MSAKSYLTKGQRALVLYTKGKRFESKVNGTGKTGNWILRKNPVFDVVMVYHHNKITKKNDIYVGTCSGINKVQNRYNLKLENLRKVGESDLDWFQFAGTGSNPVRYLSK